MFTSQFSCVCVVVCFLGVVIRIISLKGKESIIVLTKFRSFLSCFSRGTNDKRLQRKVFTGQLVCVCVFLGCGYSYHRFERRGKASCLLIFTLI